jgi:hypothetical protein
MPSSTGETVEGLGFRVWMPSSTRETVEDLGSRVWMPSPTCETVEDLGFGVQGFRRRFVFEGLGIRVQGLGFRV